MMQSNLLSNNNNSNSAASNLSMPLVSLMDPLSPLASSGLTSPLLLDGPSDKEVQDMLLSLIAEDDDQFLETSIFHSVADLSVHPFDPVPPNLDASTNNANALSLSVPTAAGSDNNSASLPVSTPMQQTLNSHNELPIQTTASADLTINNPSASETANSVGTKRQGAGPSSRAGSGGAKVPRVACKYNERKLLNFPFDITNAMTRGDAEAIQRLVETICEPDCTSFLTWGNNSKVQVGVAPIANFLKHACISFPDAVSNCLEAKRVFEKESGATKMISFETAFSGTRTFPELVKQFFPNAESITELFPKETTAEEKEVAKALEQSIKNSGGLITVTAKGTSKLYINPATNRVRIYHRAVVVTSLADANINL